MTSVRSVDQMVKFPGSVQYVVLLWFGKVGVCTIIAGGIVPYRRSSTELMSK